MNEKTVFENKYFKLLINTKNWIVVDKITNYTAYFSYIPNALEYIVLLRFERNVVKKGLIKALETLDSLKRSTKLEISIVVDALQNLIKEGENDVKESK